MPHSIAKNEVTEVPIGKVKWFDTGKGFGFLATDEGQEVFLHASALPAGVTEVKPGTRMEFGVADGRRGPQALSARILEAPPSVARATRKSADDMAVITEDLIKLLDAVSNGLRKGRYPDKKHATKVAAVLRAVADDLDV
nr:cold shock domain-containing protein [Arthrobacter gengyunqii]